MPDISRGSVATRSRCDGIFNDDQQKKEEEEERKKETTGQKYNGLPYSIGRP